MAIIELKNISGLLEATMSEYIDSAVVKEKTTRKELVSLLQATDESLDMVLNNVEGKVASTSTLQHHLELQKLEIKTLKQKAVAADTLEDKVSALTEENSKLSQELQDTAERLAEVETFVESLKYELRQASLEKSSAEEREAEVKLERDNYKLSFEGTFSELKILKSSYNLVLDRLDLIRGENIDLRESLEGYKSRGFFARIFNLQP